MERRNVGFGYEHWHVLMWVAVPLVTVLFLALGAVLNRTRADGEVPIERAGDVVKSVDTNLEGVKVLVPQIRADSRGFFFESFAERGFVAEVGISACFVQDNHSRSIKGVLRGLHYQLPPMAQGKLVRVVRGSVLDVAVDIRRSSPTFGEWFSVELTGDNHKQLWVPPGFAHGFLTLSDSADLLYKVTEYYSPAHDRGCRWDDPEIGIGWSDVGMEPILSHKDTEAPFLRDAEIFE